MPKLGKPRKTIWFHLAMKFHMSPTPGHMVGKARDCWMCQEFVEIHEKVF